MNTVTLWLIILSLIAFTALVCWHWEHKRKTKTAGQKEPFFEHSGALWRVNLHTARIDETPLCPICLVALARDYLVGPPYERWFCDYCYKTKLTYLTLNATDSSRVDMVRRHYVGQTWERKPEK